MTPRERHHRDIHRAAGPVVSREQRRAEHPSRAGGHGERGHAGERGEQDALDQQKASDAPPAGAERVANGQLAAARGHPQHQQVGDVGDSHEEHDEGDAPDDEGQPQVPRNLGRSAGPQEWAQQRGRLPVVDVFRKRRVSARGAHRGGRGRGGGLRGHAGREAHERHEGESAPDPRPVIAAACRRRDPNRQPDVRRARIGAGEAGWQHPDDLVGDVVEADGCAEGFPGEPEPPPRVAVADQRDRRRREVVVLGADQPPERGTNTEEHEELAGDPRDVEILGRLPPSVRHGPRIGGARDRGEAGAIGAKGRELAPLHPVHGGDLPAEGTELPHVHAVNAGRILDVRRRLQEQPRQQARTSPR